MSLMLAGALGAPAGRAHARTNQDRVGSEASEPGPDVADGERVGDEWPAADRALSGTIFTVTSSSDYGVGTLRQAIADANANPGADQINFDIPGAGVHTILLVWGGLNLDDTVTIDATTQPGFSGSPVVEIDGNVAGSTASLRLAAPGCVVRGLALKNFDFAGVTIAASNCVVAGNYVGVDASGSVAAPCTTGVVVNAGANNNTIGGTTAGSRNVISGNGTGVSIASNGNRVQGNYVGTNAAGSAAVPNQFFGIFLNGASSNTIGGTTAAARNVISGNGDVGVLLSGCSNNLVQGNYVGLKANGTGALGNAHEGILLQNGAANVNNTIGGTTLSAGNSIAQNGGAGVAMTSGASATGNAVLSNSIFANGALGIDLGADGVTADDAGDGDAGPNRLQNFPVLTSATTSGGATTIAGSIDSTPNTTLTIQFFHSPGGDPTTYGEGRYYLGYKTVTTNASGYAPITATFPVATSPGHVVAATATTSTNNTSEFSQTRVVM